MQIIPLKETTPQFESPNSGAPQPLDLVGINILDDFAATSHLLATKNRRFCRHTEAPQREASAQKKWQGYLVNISAVPTSDTDIAL